MNRLDWRWGLALSLAIYALCGGLLIAQGPGLQYDEALQVLGAVHMQTSPGELSLPHDPDTWLCAAGRCIPLMMVRYAGAVKDYLCFPLFAALGAHTELIRLVSWFLGAIGIFGMGWLLARHVAPAVGLGAALILAVHPAYVDLTVFDNGTVSVWMAALGFTALAISRYVGHPDTRGAFLLGASLGFGVWARANYVWMVAALAVACALVLRQRMLRPVREWAAAIAGGVVGGLPFLIYQAISHGGTFEALGMFRVSTSLPALLAQRLRMLAEVLISDREHRAMWNGPPVPTWQLLFFTGILAAALIACLVMRSNWSRVFALSFLGLAAAMFSSRMPVAEHHLIALVPLAAALAAIAAHRFLNLPLIALLAAVYSVAALGWQVSAIRGLSATGGAGQWSDGVYELNQHLLTEHAGKQIQILDWGLQNNLYVLSDGYLRSREVYPNATREQNRHGRPWSEDILRGGVFVLNGSGNRHFPEASEGFLAALAAVHPESRRWTIRQPSGEPFAEIVAIEPSLKTGFSLSDPDAAHQIEGFHDVEQSRWRWAKRNFALTFGRNAAAASVRLRLYLYIPPVVIEKAGRVTLSAKSAGRALASQMYSQPGEYTFEQTIDAAKLKPGPVRIEFAVDKTFPPTPQDDRERSIILLRASLE